MQATWSQLSRAARNPLWWHLLLLLAASATYESLFVQYSYNLLDEGWPLYAAMQLHEGGTLYRDVLWVFPPGHVLPAWLAYALAPPGVFLARSIYAGFAVAAVLALYLLGRQVMRPWFAFLGAGLVAMAAPRSHMMHLLFGYRYLIFSILALLFFALRLRTGNHRWMLAAGLFTGIALYFRVTPAFAVACALAVGAMAADRNWRSWVRDWAWSLLGFAIVILPVLAWFASTVGLGKLWYEVVVHPVSMLQPLPLPALNLPSSWNRLEIIGFFVSMGFRAYTVLYFAYAGWLLLSWARSWRRREPFQNALLLSIVVWGGIYFIRAHGRSDEAHIDTAIPPVCLLLAHLLNVLFDRYAPSRLRHSARIRWAEASVAFASIAIWMLLLGTDYYLQSRWRGFRGIAPVVQARAEQIRVWTKPDQRILDLSASPLLYVLSGRSGPGEFDIVMEGTFTSRHQEQSFIERVQEAFPALIIWPLRDFDLQPVRGVKNTAPQLVRWVEWNYEIGAYDEQFAYMFPRHPSTEVDADDAASR